MIRRLILIIIASCSLAHAEETVINTGLNEFEVVYHYRTGMRIIPHGAIEQAKQTIVSQYGPDSLLSFDRGFYIGNNKFGYVAYTGKEGAVIFLVACSKGSIHSMTVTGICRKGDWRFELIKLLELSTKELDRLDNRNNGNRTKV